ncbi:MAG: hypothetical protein C0467_12615 [Planctomycetaceae bacterium]|nr:hypothetical protein [Planctomycetaceae bacterium]
MPEPESPQLRRERIAGVVTAALVCFVLPSVALLVSDVATSPERHVAVLWFMGSFVLGVAIPMLYWSPYRAIGFATLATPAWLVAVIVSVCFVSGNWPAWPHGILLGVILGSVVRGRRGPEPGEETTAVFAAGILGVGLSWLCVTRGQPFDMCGYFLLLVALTMVGWTWTRLFRPCFELCLEPLVWCAFKIRGYGPALENFPRTGPCLVIANHACWIDPGFLGKVIPRPITPMMTARFYDLPILRRIMVSFGVIRVPEKAIKRDASEIQDAIAALDRGECVVIFPEGYLRRSEEQPLRRFGQGVWQILRARPTTPVFACWIEGAWGSYTSYFNGKPTQNKPYDLRRPIHVGVAAAERIPEEVLSEHLMTRIHLMNLTAAARAVLDLPPLPPFEIPARGEDKSDEVESLS